MPVSRWSLTVEGGTQYALDVCQDVHNQEFLLRGMLLEGEGYKIIFDVDEKDRSIVIKWLRKRNYISLGAV